METRTRVRNNPIHPGLGARQPQWKLDYIRDNAATKKVSEMREVLQLSDSFIYDYCTLHNIPLKKIKVRKGHKYGSYAEMQKRRELTIIRVPQLPDRIEKIQRPPARYDNPSHDEILDKWLKMEI